MSAIIYCRSGPAAASGADQEALCRSWCQVNEFTVGSVRGVYHEDGPPGDQLRAALERAQAIRGCFVSVDVSRWARTANQACVIIRRLADAGCRIVALQNQFFTHSPSGQVMLELVRTLTALRSDQPAQQRAALVNRKYPFGYRPHPTQARMKVPDEEEQRVIRRIVRLGKRGLSNHAIARRLNRKGIKCRGHAFHHDLVRKILAREGVSVSQPDAAVCAGVAPSDSAETET